PIQTTLAWDQFNVQNFGYDFSKGPVPLINWGTANLTDPNAWVLTLIRIRPQATENSFNNYNGHFDWKALDGLNFSAGGDFKRFSFSTTQQQRAGAQPAGLAEGIYPLGSSSTNCNTLSATGSAENCIPAAIAALDKNQYAQLLAFPIGDLGGPSGNVTK